jgi:agmatinase
MVKLHRSNADTMKDVDIVVIGVPDESNSHAKRKGTSRAPDALRVATNDSEFFERGGMLIPTCPMSGPLDGKCIFDAGNIPDKHKLRELVTDITLHGKLPIMIGGDHSLSTEAIQAVSNAIGKNYHFCTLTPIPTLFLQLRIIMVQCLLTRHNRSTLEKVC